jgi:hypothetical protein
MSEYGAVVEYMWQGKFVSMPLCPPQIPQTAVGMNAGLRGKKGWDCSKVTRRTAYIERTQ